MGDIVHCINWPDGINDNNLELIWDLRHEWWDLFHQTINTALIASLKKIITKNIKLQKSNMLNLRIGQSSWALWLRTVPSPSPALPLSTSCRGNSPAEKEVIAGWILAGNHTVQDNKQSLGYTCTVIRYLYHIELSKWKVWNKFLTTLSIGGTITSQILKIKSCFEHLFSVFSFCVLCPPSCKHAAW